MLNICGGLCTLYGGRLSNAVPKSVQNWQELDYLLPENYGKL